MDLIFSVEIFAVEFYLIVGETDGCIYAPLFYIFDSALWYFMNSNFAFGFLYCGYFKDLTATSTKLF